jgi:hypothetical protein
MSKALTRITQRKGTDYTGRTFCLMRPGGSDHGWVCEWETCGRPGRLPMSIARRDVFWLAVSSRRSGLVGPDVWRDQIGDGASVQDHHECLHCLIQQRRQGVFGLNGCPVRFRLG